VRSIGPDARWKQVPDGKYDWKPHEKSMIFGYLADMVATIPTWVTMQITQNELDVAPADGASSMKRSKKETSAELLKALDESAGRRERGAREDHRRALDDHLAAARARTGRDGGAALGDDPGHDQPLAHHRGQMTVYLRLMGAKVPALYGPSADDKRF
jgi:hypothetical protein